MNTLDVLKNGHTTFLKAIRGLTETDWHTPHAYGQESVKDILAQIVPFEHVLVEVLGSFLANCPTPTLDTLLAGYDVFMDQTVAPYQEKTIHELWTEYESAHVQSADLLDQIPPEMCHQKGTLPWYGMEFTLEDFIFYTFFGTKRKWSVQISTFRNQRAQNVIRGTA